MSPIARELDEKLKRLDPKTADLLERLVRGALELAGNQNISHAPEASEDFPPDFFRKLAEEFGPEPFERPLQNSSNAKNGDTLPPRYELLDFAFVRPARELIPRKPATNRDVG